MQHVDEEEVRELEKEAQRLGFVLLMLPHQPRFALYDKRRCTLVVPPKPPKYTPFLLTPAKVRTILKDRAKEKGK